MRNIKRGGKVHMEDKAMVEEKTKYLVEMTSKFCQAHVNSEYQELSEKLIRKLARKRHVPFLSGKIDIWAAAVIYALGQINFLFDKSFQPYVTADEICDFFNVKKSSVSQKAKVIRDMVKLNYFDPEFSTQLIRDQNPLKDLVMIDGIVVPISSLPPEMQEYVRRKLKI